MFHLVTGGSGSGKSVFAEQMLLELGKKNRIYVATMIVGSDPESRKKVDIHIDRRRGMDFQTIEAPTGLAGIELPPGANVLLEDVSNLLANEMFRPEGGGLRAARAGMKALTERCENLTVVSNEIFSDGVRYDGMTDRYLRNLALLNRELAKWNTIHHEKPDYPVPVREK